VSGVPWARLLVDGRGVGNTPRLDITLSPGLHRVRLEREGFLAFDTAITVQAAETVWLTDLRLERRNR
jgi:hypothetical protein